MFPSSVSPRALGSVWHCPAEAQDLGAHPGQVGLLCAGCQAAPRLPLPWLLSGWVQDVTCQAPAQPCHGQSSLGGQWQLPLTRSPAAAVSLPLWMWNSGLPRPHVVQQRPYPPSEPSKLLSLQTQNVFYVQACSKGAAPSSRECRCTGRTCPSVPAHGHALTEFAFPLRLLAKLLPQTLPKVSQAPWVG